MTCVVLAALGGAVSMPEPASAQLPGSGYTFDRQWNCGLFYGNQSCWFNGVLGYNSASDHSWGWASADYDGSGSVGVAVAGGTNIQSYFGASGTNLARACYLASCNDQDSRQMGVDVAHPYDSQRHTIYGHAEA
jgi:hypothetical protein